MTNTPIYDELAAIHLGDGTTGEAPKPAPVPGITSGLTPGLGTPGAGLPVETAEPQSRASTSGGGRRRKPDPQE
ncbi:hypothetical protein KCV87_08620 [Actinosynnema pretiosum subsp. pretiosum]|uniref:Uncharacterized protein n=3 Tax=Actinosynnema TaxID=40566 RepID=C6WIH3_ACTMD|nr:MULTISPECIES: hypothetical protein [Actinosynnema]ACU36216.1 hypothetical protein Amir_2276 [Actinosynnema mirum DSM 43827]ATE53855.1 hypothetical protein CNX65_11585 [Actinosynnema pretiosum]AXX29672.1 hypothetical protein APASM_2307 [Actinosynnema pretiosum subsp. pretiosum]QUF06102.1 hypothetical protein KCV87_08620 [Actinosynnema pretiosum subsp. pretiosum]